MIFRKGKRDSILVSYALLKGFLVVLLLFNPQIFLQCWYGGTHHDSLLAPDVFKCKREKEAEIIPFNPPHLLNLKKGTKNDAQNYLIFISTLTSTRKSLLCKSWFTACLSLILNQCDQKSLALRILLTRYIFSFQPTFSTMTENFYRVFKQKVCDMSCYTLYSFSFPQTSLLKIARKKKSGQNNVVGLFFRTLHFYNQLCMTTNQKS